MKIREKFTIVTITSYQQWKPYRPLWTLFMIIFTRFFGSPSRSHAGSVLAFTTGEWTIFFHGVISFALRIIEPKRAIRVTVFTLVATSGLLHIHTRDRTHPFHISWTSVADKENLFKLLLDGNNDFVAYLPNQHGKDICRMSTQRWNYNQSIGNELTILLRPSKFGWSNKIGHRTKTCELDGRKAGKIQRKWNSPTLMTIAIPIRYEFEYRVKKKKLWGNELFSAITNIERFFAEMVSLRWR